MVKKTILITVDEKVFNDVKEVCKLNGQKISSVINILLTKFLAENKRSISNIQ